MKKKHMNHLIAMRCTGEAVPGCDGAGEFVVEDADFVQWQVEVVWVKEKQKLACSNWVVCISQDYEAGTLLRGYLHTAVEQVLEQEAANAESQPPETES